MPSICDVIKGTTSEQQRGPHGRQELNGLSLSGTPPDPPPPPTPQPQVGWGVWRVRDQQGRKGTFDQREPHVELNAPRGADIRVVPAGLAPRGRLPQFPGVGVLERHPL